jgi:hypothetical protein
LGLLFTILLISATQTICTDSNSDHCPNSNQLFTELQSDTAPPPDGYRIVADPEDLEHIKFKSPADIRASMLKSSWDCPGGLCDAGFSFVHSFPRVVGNKTIPAELVENRSFGSDTVKYGIGIASLTVGIPLVILLIFCLYWCGFACCRCCCNWCGGRIATKKYSTKRQWIYRIILIVWAGLVIFCLFLAIAANHGLSRGVDSTVNGVDTALGFVDNTTVVLAAVTIPFKSRIQTLHEVANAFSHLPVQPDLAQQCYQDPNPYDIVGMDEVPYVPPTPRPDGSSTEPNKTPEEVCGADTTCLQGYYCYSSSDQFDPTNSVCGNTCDASNQFYHPGQHCCDLVGFVDTADQCNPCNPNGFSYDQNANCGDLCDPSNPYPKITAECCQAAAYPYGNACHVCNPTSPLYDRSDPSCLDPCDPDPSNQFHSVSLSCCTGPYKAQLNECDPCNASSTILEPNMIRKLADPTCGDRCDPTNPYYLNDRSICCNQSYAFFDASKCNVCDPTLPVFDPSDPSCPNLCGGGPVVASWKGCCDPTSPYYQNHFRCQYNICDPTPDSLVYDPDDSSCGDVCNVSNPYYNPSAPKCCSGVSMITPGPCYVCSETSPNFNPNNVRCNNMCIDNPSLAPLYCQEWLLFHSFAVVDPAGGGSSSGVCDPTVDPMCTSTTNEARIRNHIAIQHDLITKTTGVTTATKYPAVIATTNSLQRPLQTLRSRLSAHFNPTTDVFNPVSAQSEWDQEAANTANGLNNLPWTQLDSATSGNFFATNADFYATVSNTTMLTKSVMAPGAFQLASLSGANKSVSIITAPFLNKDFPTLISAFKVGTITTQQCRQISPQIDSLINELLEFIELNRDSKDSSILTELASYHANFVKYEFDQKWAFINNQLTRQRSLRTTLTQQWALFSQEPVIVELLKLDLDQIAAAANRLTSISSILESLTALLTQVGSPQADIDNLNTANLSTDFAAFNTFVGTSPTLSSSAWTSVYASIYTATPTTPCITTLSSQLNTGHDWLTAVNSETLFLVQNRLMLTALTVDYRNNNGGGIKAVTDNILETISEVAQGLEGTVAQGALTQLTNTAKAILDAYPTKPDRDALIALTLDLKTLIDGFNLIRLNRVLAYNTQQTQDVFTAYGATTQTSVISKFQQLFTAFTKMDQSSTTYLPSAELLLELSRRQLLVYLSSAKRVLGGCSTSVSFNDQPNLVPSEVEAMLTQMRDHVSLMPIASEIQSELTSYSTALDILAKFDAEITPVVTSVQTATRPFSLWTTSNDISTINYSSSTANPPGSSASLVFKSTLTSFDNPANMVAANIQSTTAAISPHLSTLVSNIKQFSLYSDALSILDTKRSYIDSKAHYTTAFPFTPFITKETNYIETDQNNPYGTKGQIFADIQLYANVFKETYGDILQTSKTIEQRVDDVDASVKDMNRVIDDWSDYRTTIKRSGYMIDQTRLIIIDVFIAIGLFMVFFVALFAFFKFHKMVMVCVMLLCPFIVISLILAMIHMMPTLLVADGCDQRESLLKLAVGDKGISASTTAGLISYISQETPQDIKIVDFYEYVVKCNEAAIPQIWSILRDASPDSLDLKMDDLTMVQEKVDSILNPLGKVPTPQLDNVIAQMSTISAALAGVANGVYDSIQCSKTQPVFELIIDDGVCGGVAKSGALLGALFFLASLCIMPGLFVGCSAFKVLNPRNHENYQKKYIKQQTKEGTVVYAHGYIEGQPDKGEILHFKTEDPVALEDDIKYNDLKGFSGMKHHPTNKELEMSRF